MLKLALLSESEFLAFCEAMNSEDARRSPLARLKVLDTFGLEAIV